VGPPADLFALGVILYEMLAGRHPFGPVPSKMTVAEARALLLERQRRGAPPVRGANPQAGPGLARVIERCLAFDPARRPRDAAEVAAALRRELSPSRRLGRRLRRHPRAVAAALLLAAALTSAAAAWAGSRPTWEESMLQKGEEAYRAGDKKAARDSLSALLEQVPGHSRAHSLLGRVNQEQGEFWLAIDNYKHADPQQQHGPIQACVGYCLSRLNKHREAIPAYERAIAQGLTTPEVYNDLAVSQMLNNDLRGARASLNEALKRPGPTPGAVYHNRFMLAVRELNWKGQGGVPIPASTAAIADLTEALRRGPESWELHRDAVLFYWHFKDTIPDWREEMLRHMGLAFDLGADLSAMATNVNYKAVPDLCNDQRFKDATRRPTRQRPGNHRLLDPAPDRPLPAGETS
jgi:tetratricopeptide (TPR) repeat protein